MSLWFKPCDLAEIRKMESGTLLSRLGIELTRIGPDFLQGRMPVDERTVQPMGLLHGGASVALAESLGSIGAYLTIDPSSKACVGLEVNANHIRAVRKGWVTGTARPIHIGGSTQIWSIEIRDEEDRLVCISRITMAVLEKQTP